MVLIHPDCKAEPAFWVCIQGPSECHSHKGCSDSTVEASAEFDYNGFRVGVSGIVNKILKLVEVVVDCPLALKVGGCLQDVNGSGFRIQRHKVLSEFILKIQPVDEAEAAGLCFLFKFMGRPAAGVSSLHIRHGPDNLSQIVFECFGTEADVSSAGSQEGLSGGLVSTEFGREGRFECELLLASGRGGYRWRRGTVGRRCWKRVLHVLGWYGAEPSEEVLQQLVGGFVLTLHLIHGGFDGDDTVHVDRSVVDHFRGRHGRGLVVRRGVGEGIFGWSIFRGRGVRWEAKATYDVYCVSKVSSLGGSFPTVRATAVGRDAVSSRKCFLLGFAGCNVSRAIPVVRWEVYYDSILHKVFLDRSKFLM